MIGSHAVGAAMSGGRLAPLTTTISTTLLLNTLLIGASLDAEPAHAHSPRSDGGSRWAAKWDSVSSGSGTPSDGPAEDDEVTSDPLLVASYVSFTSTTDFDLHLSQQLPQINLTSWASGWSTDETSDLALSVSNSPASVASVASSDTLTSLFTWNTLLTLILPYSIIFVLAVVGNLLVIITLTLNRSMRSVTNIFLLNLAIADLLLGVFCMPFTLVGVLLRRFIFGAFMCHVISYLQSVSVAVSVWTLVAMSVERYYAICHPFRSRESRQTRRHAYRILGLVWALAICLMLPTAIVSQLQLIPQTGNYKCREAWPHFSYKEGFTIFLGLGLLVAPLLIMILTYTSIAITLKQNVHQNTSITSTTTSNIGVLKSEKRHIPKTTSFIEDEGASMGTHSMHSQLNPQGHKSRAPPLRRSPYSSTSSTATTLSSKPFTGGITPGNNHQRLHQRLLSPKPSHCRRPYSFRDFLRMPGQGSSTKCTTTTFSSSASMYKPTATVTASGNSPTGSLSHGKTITSSSTGTLRVNSNLVTIQARQRRVVVMLCVVVVEFFICWTPVFIMDTLALYQPALVYGSSRNLSAWIGIDIISACHLLCFCSSCTNPVTYCFMNRRFRRHFFALFRCRKGAASGGHVAGANGTMLGGAPVAGYISNATNEPDSEQTLTVNHNNNGTKENNTVCLGLDDSLASKL